MTVVAITGGTGFVGAAVVSRLAAVGIGEVRVLTRSPDKASIGHQLVVGDLEDDEACDRFVAGADVVVHAAGLVRSRDAAALQRVNVDGTIRVLQAARRAGVRRFVHLSSTGVYGSSGRSVDETNPRHPANPYERSKALAESLVLGDRQRGDVVVIQPSNVVGVGAPVRPLRRFLQRSRAGRPVVHAGAWTNYVGVGDVASVVVAAATLVTVPPVLIVNVPMPLEEFAILVGRTVGRHGRTMRLPDLVGSAAAPFVRAGAARFSGLERVRALLDRTRYVTSHQDWFDQHGLTLALEPVLVNMAADYGIVQRG
jgi:nucleoside-diphosphate-sugar epimerase